MHYAFMGPKVATTKNVASSQSIFYFSQQNRIEKDENFYSDRLHQEYSYITILVYLHHPSIHTDGRDKIDNNALKTNHLPDATQEDRRRPRRGQRLHRHLHHRARQPAGRGLGATTTPADAAQPSGGEKDHARARAESVGGRGACGDDGGEVSVYVEALN